MQVLKSGVTCPMILKVISGPLVVSSMRCAHLFHHSEQMICKAFTRKSSKGSFQGYQTTSVRKWQQSLSSCCKYPPTTDHLVTKYWHCLLLRLFHASSSQKKSSSKTIQKLLIYWELSGLAAICSLWLRDCQRVNIEAGLRNWWETILLTRILEEYQLHKLFRTTAWSRWRTLEDLNLRLILIHLVSKPIDPMMKFMLTNTFICGLDKGSR